VFHHLGQIAAEMPLENLVNAARALQRRVLARMRADEGADDAAESMAASFAGLRLLGGRRGGLAVVAPLPGVVTRRLLVLKTGEQAAGVTILGVVIPFIDQGGRVGVACQVIEEKPLARVTLGGILGDDLVQLLD